MKIVKLKSFYNKNNSSKIFSYLKTFESMRWKMVFGLIEVKDTEVEERYWGNLFDKNFKFSFSSNKS